MTSELDEDDQRIAETIARIERFGFTTVTIGTGECDVPGCTHTQPEPYTYAFSLGMIEHTLDEYVVFGLPAALVHHVLHAVCQVAIDEQPLAVGYEHRHSLPGGPIVTLLDVPDQWVQRDLHRVGSWLNVYGASTLPRFVQIFWADRNGHMPWDDGCDPHLPGAQPILADDPISIPKPPRNRSRHLRAVPNASRRSDRPEP